jgi:hypothetical protein
VSSSTASPTTATTAATKAPPPVIPEELLHPHELDVTYVAPFDQEPSLLARLPLASIAVFIIVLTVYARTAYRTVTGIYVLRCTFAFASSLILYNTV